MSELVIRHEFGSIARGTHRSLGLSAFIHALLIMLLLFSHKAATETMGLTEITWEDATPAPEAAPPLATKVTPKAPVQPVKMQAAVAPSPTPPPVPVERPLQRASVSPDAQSVAAVTDIVSKKLDSWQQSGKASTTGIASLAPAPKVGVPTLAGVSGDHAVAAGKPSALARDAGPSGGAPVALTRTEHAPAAPVAAVTVKGPPMGSGGGSAPATAGSGKSRNLAGAQLAGPVADRPLIAYKVPPYPEWAKEDAVEGAVTLYFYVLPDGHVKENIVVERTSGFSDFDNGAIEALRQWRFQAIPGSKEQWGRITFNYRLSDAQ